MGDNSVISTSSPVQTISGGTNWKHTALWQQGALAIKTDGSLWSWGNTYFTGTSTPVQIISNGTYWKSIAAGASGVAIAYNNDTL